MKNLLKFIKRKKFLFLGLLVLLVVIFAVGGRNSLETYTVEIGDVRESIILSGYAQSNSRADLGFAAAGRIAKIYVSNNQSVKSGQILAQLEVDDLLADLRIKEANSQTSVLDLEAARDNLEKVKIQEENKVANAYRALLSSSLELVPDSDKYVVATPLISGVYDGPEGTYKIRIDRENVSSSKMSLYTFDLEKTEVFVNEEGKTRLGTRGLYIEFPDDINSYKDTNWYLEIPNLSGESYLASYNAYVDAKSARDLRVREAEAQYERALAEEGGPSPVAQAEIQKIRAEIKKNTIYAPFVGQVTSLSKQEGENISSGERLMTLLGDGKLEVVLQVPELDVPKLSVGSEIDLRFDALPGEIFSGLLESLNSKETEIDGVPVYEAFVVLSADARIKTGMSAKGEIVLAERKDVLAIPSYLIMKEGVKNFVNILLPDGEAEKREVVLGILGSDSTQEVISGLKEGEMVIVRE